MEKCVEAIDRMNAFQGKEKNKKKNKQREALEELSV